MINEAETKVNPHGYLNFELDDEIRLWNKI